jgi:hypothetical protein
MVPNARFIELLQDIEPSPTTVSHAQSGHLAVRAHLRSHPTFAAHVVGDFLAGSYARDTGIRPKRTDDGYERPDVDIIIETDFTRADRPNDVLNTLAKALESEFEVERINKRSIRILTANAEVDVVPVHKTGLIYELPDRDLNDWKYTNPPSHNAWSSGRNKEFGDRFKKLVKLTKWWRRENKTGKRPKGFILEYLVALHTPRDESHFGEAFAQFLESLHQSYGRLAEIDGKPTLMDPGLPGHSSDIMSKVSLTDWKNFMDKVRVHAGYARRAQNEDDLDEATRLWRILFGPRFKATVKAAVGGTLTTTVAAAAPAAGYTFPSQSAAPPPNKPRSFA